MPYEISGLGVESDGTLWAWGYNYYGQLGDGQITPEKIGLPTLLAPPMAQSALTGSRVSFAVTASGSKPLAYQWQRDGDNLMDNPHLSGSQYASLTLFDLQGADAGSYRVIISNSYGNVTSAVVTLTVQDTRPSFGTIQNLPAGMTFHLSGDTGRAIELYASTNLLNWSLLTTLTNQTGTVRYTDTESTNLPARFYKAIQLP
jgi:hypothetical protein